ncbi:unnamed protein product, partial [Mesorhabditis belari]|uniref:Acyltransferase n=1 Tax=Mesorhabditis belari TaxID=2138241 RepID=A0AAF3EIZ1_9BILA
MVNRLPKIPYKLLSQHDDLKNEAPKKAMEFVSNTRNDFREDIALLRAIAILAVLGYHFSPTVFPMGFVGVDIFFVISGYLIMSILEKSKDRPHRVFLSFYYRRLKRIVPLYHFVLFFIGLALVFCYTPIWAKRYFSSYFQAIFFYLNFDLLWADGNYFAEATEKLPFLHLWSLGVEMQFYLIAPIIFYISKFDAKIRLGQFILLSFAFYSLYFQYNSNKSTAFYHPLARIWQFLSGMLASQHTEEAKMYLESTRSNTFSMVFMVFVFSIFLPLFHGISTPSAQQIFVTISATGVMLFSPAGSIDWGLFRLQYIAEISYSLYLVHYPILKVSEYLVDYYIVESQVKWITFLLTIVMSALVNRFLEKPILSDHKTRIFIKSLFCFAGCLLLSLKWSSIVDQSWSEESVIAANARYAGKSYYPLYGGKFVSDAYMSPPVPPFGHYVYLNNTGKLKIAIFGNSWATQQAHMIRKFFPPNQTASLNLFSMPKRTPFMLKFLKRTRPDLVFILLRNGDYGAVTKDDGLVEIYWEGIRNISKYAKEIFIEGHHPFDCEGSEKDFLYHYIDNLQKEADLTKMNPTFNDSFYEAPINQRVKIIMERCAKCHLLDVAEAFIDHFNQRVLTYDPKTKLAFLDNQCHLTPAGLEKIENPIREAIKKALGKNFQ